MDIVDQYISEVPIFGAFSDRERVMLPMLLKPREFEPDEAIFSQREPGRFFFVVASGKVVITKRLPGGPSLRLGVAERGHIVGVVSALDKKPRLYTATAMTKVRGLVCMQDELERLFNANSTFAFKILDMVTTQLSLNLRDANLLVSQMHDQPVETIAAVQEKALDVVRTLSDSGMMRAYDPNE